MKSMLQMPNLSTMRRVEADPEKVREKNKIFRDIREKWVQFMLGKKSSEAFEKVDISAIMPDLEALFGQRFSFKGGKWWKTQSVLGDRTLEYPREFACVPKNIPEKERARQMRMLKGGLFHEAGHHVGIVKVFEKFLWEADTQQNIIADLPLGRADIKNLREILERTKSSAGETRDLERLAEAVNIGPHLGNMPFIHDLHNIVLDIWLEAYEKRHPNPALRSEVQTSLDEVNDALFSEIPKLAGKGALRSSQFRTALIFKKGATANNLALGKGYDAWFQKKVFDPEVQEALASIIPAYEALTSRNGFDDCITPQEMIKWVKRAKFESAYLPIRSAYLKLLDMDIRERIDQSIQETKKRQKEKRADGMPESGPGAGGEPRLGGKGDPKSFDDLDPETQAKILHDILDQIEEERVSHNPIGGDDLKNEGEILRITRDAAEGEVRKRQAVKAKKDGKAAVYIKPGEGEPRSPALQNALNQAERAERERQWHQASELERAEMLGLSLEQLREYEQKKMAMSGKIHIFSDALAQALLKKMVPEKRTEQPVGRLMRGRLPDYLRSRSRGEEALTFEYMHIKRIIPELNFIFLSDHSTSMDDNDKNKKAAEVALLFTESLMSVEREIARHGLSIGNKKGNQLRFATITFTDKATLRKPLDTPLDAKVAAQMYFTVQDISGGGTADAEALANTITYLKETAGVHKGNRRPLSVIVILSDGAGEREKLREVLEAAGSMRDRLFIVVGAGTGSESVLESYGEQLRNFPVVPIYVSDKDLDRLPERIIESALQPIVRSIARL